MQSVHHSPIEAAGPHITTRELDVLRMTAEGHRIKDIAYHMGISTKTVEFHRSNLRHKLGCPTTAHLIRFALEYHLLS